MPFFHPGSLHGLPSTHVCVLFSSSDKNSNQIGLRPTLTKVILKNPLYERNWRSGVLVNHTPTIEHTVPPKNIAVRTVHFFYTRVCLELCSAVIRVHVSYPLRAAESPALVQIIILPCIMWEDGKWLLWLLKRVGNNPPRNLVTSQPFFLDRPPYRHD